MTHHKTTVIHTVLPETNPDRLKGSGFRIFFQLFIDFVDTVNNIAGIRVAAGRVLDQLGIKAAQINAYPVRKDLAGILFRLRTV